MMNERNIAAAIIAFAGILMAGLWIPRMQALADASGAGCRVTTPAASTRTAIPDVATRTYPRALHVMAHIPESAVVPGEDPTPVWRIVPDENETRCVIATPSPAPHAATRYTLLTGETIATELALDSGGNRLLLIAADDASWKAESFLPASLGPALECAAYHLRVRRGDDGAGVTAQFHIRAQAQAEKRRDRRMI